MWNFILGILSNWVADALGAAITGGAVLAWIKQRRPSWLPAVYVGLGGGVVILIGAGALRVISTPIPRQPDIVTVDNVEAHLNQWIDAFHYSRRKLPDAQDSFFNYVITNTYGRSLNISRLRQSPFDRYLVMSAGVTVGPEHTAKLGKLSKPDADLLVRDLRIEMARYKIGFANISIPLTTIGVEKDIPITTTLSEDTFLQATNDVDSAQVLLLNLIPMELDKPSRAH
jgi:hypothetical protein